MSGRAPARSERARAAIQLVVALVLIFGFAQFAGGFGLVGLASFAPSLGLLGLYALVGLWTLASRRRRNIVIFLIAFLPSFGFCAWLLAGDALSGTRIIETTVTGAHQSEDRGISFDWLDTADGSFRPPLFVRLPSGITSGPHRLLLTERDSTLLAVDP